MPLTVPTDRSFIIIPKHSTLPLAPTHHRKEKGNTIQQQEAYVNNPAQQFQLKKNGTGEYLVYLPYSGLYWATAGGPTSGEGAALIQWLNQDTTNQRFRFLHAGNGYYYLRPVHAGGLVLEVPGAGHGQETLKLGKLAPASNRDHQLFRIVPASLEYMSDQSLTFRKYSDMMRDVLLGLTGLIPTVGGGAKAALGVVWPDGHDQDFWNQMTQYVEQRVKALLQADNLKRLHGHLNGLRKKTKEFMNTTQPDDKVSKLIAAISEATGDEDDFLRDYEGVTVLSMLPTWGTLVMVLRAEMVQGYAQLHPNKPLAEQQNGQREELGFLQEAIRDYSAGVERARERAMAWRLGHIQQGAKEYTKDYDFDRYSLTEFHREDWVVDQFDGWRMDRSKTEYSNRKPTTGDPNSHANITYAKQAREAQVRAKFGAELDTILAPSYLWPYLDYTKTTKPTDHRIQVAVGTFGGRPGGTPFHVSADNLIKITICSNASHPYLCGLNLTFAGSGTTALYGVMGGRQNSINLQAGEYITNVRGYEWDVVESLMLETNYGQLVEGGLFGNHSYFEGGPDDAVNAKLMSISGTYQGDIINTLTFHWEYTLSK
ncbi:RICIN domain-containing protein [Hymenobacter sp. UYP22]|uniref:RICIN domain-containing protein n=1 Tax=Hymenobacter sp. UYP22 TaxID=3156348 RepID=UPI003394523F